MKKTKILIVAFTSFLLLAESTPLTYANQTIAVASKKLSTSIIVDYSNLESNMKFGALQFRKSTFGNGIAFDYGTMGLITANSKITIDDSKKKVILSCDIGTYIFPYVKVKNTYTTFEITTPNKLVISFELVSNLFNTTYKSAVKSIPTSLSIFKNSKYFTSYKEEFKKVFIKNGDLDNEAVQELMCYLYLDDQQSFNDWVKDNSTNISTLHDEISDADNSEVDEDSINDDSEESIDSDDNIESDDNSLADDSKKQYGNLTQWFETYGMNISNFIDSKNYDDDKFKESAYKKLRAEFLDYLNKNPKIKSAIKLKADSVKTKVITVTCKGALINDNNFEYYLYVKNTYLSFDNKDYISKSVTLDEDNSYTIRLDDDKAKQIYIIKYEK
jgi:hypothetical protein